MMNIAGVDSVDIDMEKQKVTVRGYVEKSRVLKVVRRSGRRAEFWPYPYDNEYHPYASQYLEESNFTSSHNYYVHGYNESVHGYFPHLPYPTIDDHISYRFSDDNVHACALM
ncbi:heavy metal-associated isoprenylated plant protein 30 [Sesamum indicum]|uniref:Heavy metal-associated isoprenylated plant protein 30 n=1 Tax=Sesamum indicum TaxID=4182 RepID=A0A8M8ULF1_SESIN|nr:heavy metal-associated isoprenylated plant protein 30 [Sesamum indicum]